jgi:hypothetical protein
MKVCDHDNKDGEKHGKAYVPVSFEGDKCPVCFALSIIEGQRKETVAWRESLKLAVSQMEGRWPSTDADSELLRSFADRFDELRKDFKRCEKESDAYDQLARMGLRAAAARIKQELVNKKKIGTSRKKAA